jgi:uncharacterized tellurite resistance protein B-like protein
VLRRLLGRAPSEAPAQPDDRSVAGPEVAETRTVRRIVSQLEALPPDERRFVAGFAYVLGRAANADLHVHEDELAQAERLVREVGGLTEAQAVLVFEIARAQEELHGATEDYLVTREFARLASRDQREALLRAAFAVVAADGSISAMESAELNQIGKELGFTAEEVDRVRTGFADRLGAVQEMRRMVADADQP